MAEKHIADKEAEFVAVNGPPDMCRVGNSVVPFDITDTLDKARDPSANVHARGNPVLTQTTRVNAVAGDAGSGIVSGVSRGHTIVLQGSSTVFVNGKPCARHDDPVGMNCNGGDTFNTTGQLKTLKLGPKPKWGSKEAGQGLRERLKETSQELHDNPMGKTPEQAAAVQDKVKQLVTDTAEHEKAAMQSLRNGDSATWTEASTLKSDARNMVAEAERQAKWANSTSKELVDVAVSQVPLSGVPEAVQDGGKAWSDAKGGNYRGATAHAAMAVVGIATELPVLKQLKGAWKARKALKAAEDAKQAAEAAKDAKKAVEAAQDADAAKDAVKGAEAAQDGAKAAESAKDADNAADAAGGGKKGGGKDGVVIRSQTKVPCFHPFDKKKFQKMSPEDKKAYLKEMADQLRKQEAEINKLTAVEYKAARDAFKSMGRNPVAEGAQATFRQGFAKQTQRSLQNSLVSSGMSAGQAKAEAASRTKELMAKLVALHEPDMVAGGWTQPIPKGMGRTDVNSSIGASWNQDGRVTSMDKAAEDAIKSGRGHENMNVKLEPCRGKGMR